MATRIYVEIDRQAGDYRTSLNEISKLQTTATFAGIGASVGSVIPGVGNAIGGAAGAAVGFLGSVFGLGSGKDEVRDIMRKILYAFWGQIMPGKVATIGSRGVPLLVGQYRPEDIAAILAELHKRTIAGLEPGSDSYIDLSRAFRSIRFFKKDSPNHYLVMAFDAIDQHSQNDANPTDNDGGFLPDSSADGGGPTVSADAVFGMPRGIILGGIGLLGLLFLAR